MNIAIKYGAAIVEDGHVGGHDAGATLVRRLHAGVPRARAVGGRAAGTREGFDVVPLEFLDPVDDRRDQHGRDRLDGGLAHAGPDGATSRRS